MHLSFNNQDGIKLGIFLLTENFHDDAHNTILNDIETACYAEELGFDEVWFGEHHFNSFSVIPNPSLMMANLAAKTKSIRIGTAAFLTPFYNTTRLAEEIATLDNLSNGRINAGFAKGGFALDLEYFNKNSDTLRDELYANVKDIEQKLYKDEQFQPKPLQEKIPTFIATFATKETIAFAAHNGYGLMFSQGTTLDACEEAQESYKNIAGFYPQTVLMRVFAVADTKEEAKEIALPATDHFVKSMRAVKAKGAQPKFNKANYNELLAQRYAFFDAKTFMEAAIVGSVDDCIEHILNIKRRIKNLHLTLKVASSESNTTTGMLKIFSQKIKPKI
ncbi:LLM class flavin-dependent oxidoreductase [Sulfurimonas crateris]|uniref:LLM class flavin-dependent oxidoreductase n=1 Tax=Sulfurimonas crateris TaxID=2574727 RepID=A0A4U2Z581_9BACT|nr:LLM class flavin-dependent oxidoreductase [Sulfurimonas crateris]TKI69329.1 LLM class flavin-dependent oxidoreductase [Sulfurimonas crateris]